MKTTNEYIPKRGEQVFLLERDKIKGLKIPNGDLMIFDKVRAVLNTYDAHGAMTRQTLFDEYDDIGVFVDLAQKLKKLAKPIHG